MVPAQLSQKFYQSLDSKDKNLILIDNAGHEHYREVPDKLAQILIN